jgi:hypothetical protein
MPGCQVEWWNASFVPPTTSDDCGSKGSWPTRDLLIPENSITQRVYGKICMGKIIENEKYSLAACTQSSVEVLLSDSFKMIQDGACTESGAFVWCGWRRHFDGCSAVSFRNMPMQRRCHTIGWVQQRIREPRQLNELHATSLHVYRLYYGSIIQNPTMAA